MSKELISETQREIADWPDTSMTQENAGKHSRIVLHYKGESRMVVVAKTPSDIRAVKNHIAIVRRELRGMGATRNKVIASQTQRERNKPVRIDLPREAAPVMANPLAKLEGLKMQAIDAIFENIGKLRYAEMLEFAEKLSCAAMESKLKRSDVHGWARTLQSALDMHKAG